MNITERRLFIVSADVSGCYNLIAEGEDKPLIYRESFAVCDQVKEALYGHRAGVSGECLETADAILSAEERDRYRFGGPNYDRASTPDGV